MIKKVVLRGYNESRNVGSSATTYMLKNKLAKTTLSGFKPNLGSVQVKERERISDELLHSTRGLRVTFDRHNFFED